MAVRIRNGVASFELYGSERIFAGTTSMEGQFPPLGVSYDQFVFAPKPGTSGTLVFSGVLLGKHTQDLYPFEWRDGKLFVHFSDWKKIFPTLGKADTVGYYLQIGDVTYVTGEPVDNSRVFKKVTIFDLLMYIEQRIDLPELNRRVLRRKIAEKKERAQDKMIRDLQSELRTTKTAFNTANNLAVTLTEYAATLRYILRKIPRPLRWVISGRLDTKDQGTLKRVWSKERLLEFLNSRMAESRTITK